VGQLPAGSTPLGGWAGFWEGVEFAGAALFTVFVKGADFFSTHNHQCAKKGQIGIGQWGNRMERKKTRTLERHKDAAPGVQEHSKVGAPGRMRHPEVQNRSRGAAPCSEDPNWQMHFPAPPT
jgi:hypothetical protein